MCGPLIEHKTGRNSSPIHIPNSASHAVPAKLDLPVTPLPMEQPPASVVPKISPPMTAPDHDPETAIICASLSRKNPESAAGCIQTSAVE